MTIVKQYFTFLEKNKINYVVVGDTRGYPENIDGDIDIVVEPQDLSRMGKLLLQFCSMHEKLSLVQMVQHEDTALYFVLAFHDEKNIIFLQPDICGNYLRNGKFILSAKEILKNRIEAIDTKGKGKEFFVPEPKMEFIYYLLKKIDKQELCVHHGIHLSEEWKKAPAECMKQINKFWEGEDAKLLENNSNSGKWDNIKPALARLQQSIHQSITFSFLIWIREVLRRVKRVLQPTGIFIAVLGTDGSGKSSVIKEIMHDLIPAFRKTQYVHLRPRIGLKVNDVSIPVSDPHKLKPRGLFSSVAKCIYFFIDYSIGYLTKVRPLLVRSTFVVFDRYYHDILVDPKRYRYGGPLWIARLIAKIVPKPDIVILLDAPAEILQSRKQEVPFNETKRQRNAYLKLIAEMENGIIVDASQPLPLVIADVNKIILEHMAQRMVRRIG